MTHPLYEYQNCIELDLQSSLMLLWYSSYLHITKLQSMTENDKNFMEKSWAKMPHIEVK
jgi:hypothetical protein